MTPIQKTNIQKYNKLAASRKHHLFICHLQNKNTLGNIQLLFEVYFWFSWAGSKKDQHCSHPFSHAQPSLLSVPQTGHLLLQHISVTLLYCHTSQDRIPSFQKGENICKWNRATQFSEIKYRIPNCTVGVGHVLAMKKEARCCQQWSDGWF